MTSDVVGSCHHDCPDTCSWKVTVDGGVAVKIRGHEDHPTTQGQLCPKVNRFLDRVYHEDRILTPLVRVGPKGSGDFEPTDWPSALRLVGDRFRTLIEHGRPESILQFSFDGTQGVIQKGIMADRFFDTIGASDIRRHLCGVTAWLGAADVMGTPFGIDPEELEHSQTIILWGTNTYLTNRHLWPVIETARQRGATIVVIDPVRTTTADKADLFLQLKPGTDVALVLGMFDVLRREGHVGDVPSMPVGDAAEVTGIPEAEIEALAIRYATVQPSAIRVLVGPEHRHNGRDIMRAIAMLPAATGAWRHKGGGLARSTQVYFEEALNYPEQNTERRRFNMSRLGDVLTDSSMGIEALLVHNSNPAVVLPDQNRVIAGLEREDLFTVVVEQFMTDTARYADVILPATTQIEHLDLGIAWGHMYLSLNQPAIAPVGESLPNTEIFRRLATELELSDPALQDTDENLIRSLLDTDHPWTNGITYERLNEDGWARLTVPKAWRPDATFDLSGVDFQPTLEPPAQYPLMLISRKQHVKFLNANYGGFSNHLPRQGAPFVEMHPDDAASRSIEEGTTVTVRSNRGSLTLSASITTDTQPGLVAIPFGWWNDATPEGRSVNALTNASVPATDEGSSAFHDTFVEVSRATDRLEA